MLSVGTDARETRLMRSRSVYTSGIEGVTLYSETCGGQNRNQFVVSCLVHCLQEISHLYIIKKKFLENGHSEME
jgi:hypothetical protein